MTQTLNPSASVARRIAADIEGLLALSPSGDVANTLVSERLTYASTAIHLVREALGIEDEESEKFSRDLCFFFEESRLLARLAHTARTSGEIDDILGSARRLAAEIASVSGAPAEPVCHLAALGILYAETPTGLDRVIAAEIVRVFNAISNTNPEALAPIRERVESADNETPIQQLMRMVGGRPH